MKFSTTFYRRPLPPSCTALSSGAGRKLFASAAANNGLKSFFFLVEHFLTQSEPAYCGLSTLVMVLNALSVDPRSIWKGPWRWYEESMLNCCVDMEQAKQTGITIPQFVCLARCQGLVAEETYGSESTVDQFRDAVKLSCVESIPREAAAADAAAADSDGATRVGDNKPSDNPFLVVSYSRRVLGQTGSGHFSPVAAYDDLSDQVLILDTARFKYGPHWVPLTLLYDALLVVDPTTDRSRGYVLLSLEDDHDEECPHLPQSVLFRSRMCQFDVRCRYLDFLSKREAAAAENGNGDGEGGKKEPITFREVIRFWTDDGNDPEFVWKMIDPQLAPVNADEKKVVDAVLSLIDFLVERQLDEEGGDSSVSSLTSFCRTNASRIVPIDALGAMFVVYLASLPPDSGREVVHAGSTDDAIDDETTELAREQLLAEGELIRYAIDFSQDCADVDFACDAEQAAACGKRCSSGDQDQCS